MYIRIKQTTGFKIVKYCIGMFWSYQRGHPAVDIDKGQLIQSEQGQNDKQVVNATKKTEK